MIIANLNIFSQSLWISPLNTRQEIYKIKEKTNRFLSILRNLKLINEETYMWNTTYLAANKVCYINYLKLSVPMRPIFFTRNSPIYKLLKFLVPILSSLTTYQCTLSNMNTDLSPTINLFSGDNLTCQFVWCT